MFSGESCPPVREHPLRRFAGLALWALPLWAVLLAVSTLTHQPDPATDFGSYAEYITTERFLLSHLVASIFGAGFGTVGFLALFIALTRSSLSALPLVALVASVFGNTLVTSVFGVAAFAQPAIGEAYLAGETAQAMAFDESVYGVPLFATAGIGLLLFATGLIAFGIAVQRSGLFPAFSGGTFALGGLLFTVIGFLFVDVLQPVGALLMAGASVAMAVRGGHAPERDA